MTDDARRRRRRGHLMLWALPLAIVAGLFSLKLVHQHITAEMAVAAYLDGDAEGALNLASQLQYVNLVERWKPDYDIGTSLLELGALEDARGSFERALPLAAPAEQCPIRANLAITLEREGDAALAGGDTALAIEKYQQALVVIGEQDASCEQSTSNRSLDESEVRITEKLEELLDPQGGEGDEGEDGSGGEGSGESENQPDPGQLDKIEEGLEGNQEEREDDLRENENWGGGGSSVDQPW